MTRKKFQDGTDFETLGSSLFDPDALAGVTTDVTRFAPFMKGLLEHLFLSWKKQHLKHLQRKTLLIYIVV